MTTTAPTESDPPAGGLEENLIILQREIEALAELPPRLLDVYASVIGQTETETAIPAPGYSGTSITAERIATMASRLFYIRHRLSEFAEDYRA